LLLFSTAVEAQKINIYPITSKDATSDVYFNKTIEDPYRWMEAPNSPRLIDWLAKQKKLTKAEQHKHFNVSELEQQFLTIYYKTKKKSLYKENNKNAKHKKYSFKYEYNSSKRTPNLMYKKFGQDNYKTLVNSKRFKSGLDDNPIIEGYKVNDENTFVAVNISHSGSDWMETYFFNLETGDQLPDTLNYLRFNSNPIWADDGIYYDRYNKPEPGRALLDKAKGQRFCYHKLNDPQSNDKVL
jgi:prolyl oligopeptidase